MADDIVTQSQQHGIHHDKTGTDEEYIQHLELKLDKANDEIERLRVEIHSMTTPQRIARATKLWQELTEETPNE